LLMQMDEVIPPNGTRSYYEAVTAGDSSVHEYYKLCISLEDS
jgi:hypothetical protein